MILLFMIFPIETLQDKGSEAIISTVLVSNMVLARLQRSIRFGYLLLLLTCIWQQVTY